MITDILNKILEICCEEFEVSREEALSKSQKKELVFLRKIFVTISKNNFNIPNEKLCRFLNCTSSNIDALYKKRESDKYFIFMLEDIQKLSNNLQKKT